MRMFRAIDQIGQAATLLVRLDMIFSLVLVAGFLLWMILA